jgi:phosphatidylethanolamine-binding protein (PEBP) family uncharacterized protein
MLPMLTLPRYAGAPVALVVVVLCLVGCGGSTVQGEQPGARRAAAPEPKAKLGTPAHLPLLTGGIGSTGFSKAFGLSSKYTCDGADISPPLRWSSVPSGTVELVVTVVDFEFVHNEPVVRWAVAGLSPKLRELSAGTLPPGAIVGRNSTGQARYELCPPRGAKQQYALSVWELPRRIPVGAGFNSVALHNRLLHLATAEKVYFFSYKRR